MKSGDYSISRDDEYHRDEFAEIVDRRFSQRTFASHAALVAKEAVDGCKMWTDYQGQPFDPSSTSLVEGMWDHEHCSVCLFKIKDGHTYWENRDRIKLLCDPATKRAFGLTYVADDKSRGSGWYHGFHFSSSRRGCMRISGRHSITRAQNDFESQFRRDHIKRDHNSGRLPVEFHLTWVSALSWLCVAAIDAGLFSPDHLVCGFSRRIGRWLSLFSRAFHRPAHQPRRRSILWKHPGSHAGIRRFVRCQSIYSLGADRRVRVTPADFVAVRLYHAMVAAAVARRPPPFGRDVWLLSNRCGACNSPYDCRQRGPKTSGLTVDRRQSARFPQQNFRVDLRSLPGPRDHIYQMDYVNTPWSRPQVLITAVVFLAMAAFVASLTVLSLAPAARRKYSCWHLEMTAPPTARSYTLLRLDPVPGSRAWRSVGPQG